MCQQRHLVVTILNTTFILTLLPEVGYSLSYTPVFLRDGEHVWREVHPHDLHLVLPGQVEGATAGTATDVQHFHAWGQGEVGTEGLYDYIRV